MPEAKRFDAARKGSTLRLAVRKGDASVADRPQGSFESAASEKAALAPGVVEVRVRLDGEQGLVEARRQCREISSRGRFRATDQAMIAAIVSELGRNILLYASRGEILVRLMEEHDRVGILISATDAGPGIAELSRAMTDGYSTSGRPGLGLAGARRLADDFDIACGPEGGTRIVVRKWRK